MRINGSFDLNLNVDWRALWNYLQVDDSTREVVHSLCLRRVRITVQRQAKLAGDNQEEEFFDAKSDSSIESLEEELEENLIWMDLKETILSQLALKIEGDVNVQFEDFECKIVDGICISSVADGNRTVEVGPLTVQNEEISVEIENGFNGSISGNNWLSLNAKNGGEISCSWKGNVGSVQEITFIDGIATVSSIKFPELLEVEKVTFDIQSMHASISSLNVVSIPSVNSNTGSTITLPPISIHINQLQIKPYNLAAKNISGKWPHLQIQSIQVDQLLTAENVYISRNQSIKDTDSHPFTNDKLRFVNNLPVQVFSAGEMPQFPLQIRAGLVKVHSIDFNNQDSTLELPLASSLWIDVLEVSNLVSLSQVRANYSTENGLHLRATNIQGQYESLVRVNQASIELAFLKQDLTACLSSANVSIDLAQLMAMSPQNKHQSALPNFHIYCQDSQITLQHAQLPQDLPIKIASLDVFNNQMILDDLQCKTPSFAFTLGAVVCFNFETIDCDALNFDITDEGEFKAFSEALQTILSPPLPLPNPQITHYPIAEVDAEVEKGLQDDIDEESFDNEMDETAAIEVDNLDLEALQDALLEPETILLDYRQITIKSVTFTSPDFHFRSKFSSKFTSDFSYFKGRITDFTLLFRSHPFISRWNRKQALSSLNTDQSAHIAFTLQASPTANEEYQLKLAICPLHIQSNLEILNYFSQPSPLESGSQYQGQYRKEIFFAQVHVESLAIKLDLPPTLNGAHLLLPGGVLRGVSGGGGLLRELSRLWLPSISSTSQLNRVLLSGVLPVRTTVQMSTGAIDLILLPAKMSKQSSAVSMGQARRACFQIGNGVINATSLIVNQLRTMLEAVLIGPNEASKGDSLTGALKHARRTVVAVCEADTSGDSSRALFKAIPVALLAGGAIALESLTKEEE